MVDTATAVRFDEKLVSRYGGRGPRYTSYPTALQFTGNFTADAYRRNAMASNDSGKPLSVYVHIPFCRSLCYYCGCNKIVTRNASRVQSYLEALYTEIGLQAALFDRGRKRSLPALPRRIGVVTSIDGAALRDILRVLIVRHPRARVVVRPARVQGDGAAEDLIRALRAIVRVPDVDVVLIGRGGGSVEDLWAFNDERLARAIVQCPVPVISCVGHEVDFTKWQRLFPNQANAVATADRLVDGATILRFTGATCRNPKEVTGAPLED